MRYRHCEAKLVSEEFQQPARGVRAKSVPREVRKPVFPAVPAAR
jgi:hypothetical protein